jgi:hypothetical protein
MPTLGDAADVNPVIKFLPHRLQHLMVDSSDCLHDPLSRQSYPVVKVTNNLFLYQNFKNFSVVEIL